MDLENILDRLEKLIEQKVSFAVYMPWLEMYMKRLVLRHIIELEERMMYSTPHCTPELQSKTTMQCVTILV